MESLVNIKRKYNRHTVNSSSLLRFKKFEMNVDGTAVHIRLSAHFLETDNYQVQVKDGVLHLKIKYPVGTRGSHKNSFKTDTAQRDIDLEIRLPDRRHKKINSVRFKNGILQVHLVQKDKIDDLKKLPNLCVAQINESHYEKVH
ncbi:hypothetical protein [uncultured Kriegella sp.]|uniref:hypothetical protein n=1 Tax=uncultured Kriegella sp. TaxID=1798910 RepID=UPI0030D75E03|tara:strand:- start:63270 stop:63701 length:432 start_codon:yes stop_codon:yes gene_type:complete